jgi:glycerate-2-kinase
MVSIKNKAQLVENGGTLLNKKARQHALQSLEHALEAADPRQLLKARLTLKGSKLKIDKHSFDLAKYRNLYVMGGGKASGMMAEGLEQILGKRITKGLVNVPHDSKSKIGIIQLHGATHPVPDRAGVEGTRQMLRIAEDAEKNDLIICLISGGGSSLMPLPRDDVSLENKKEITNSLLRSGATINEINTVRKHISAFKGGWLAEKAYPATILNLILSDVVGDPLDFIASGPTVPDSTTFDDAAKVLQKYNLWEKAPASVRKILSDGKKGLIPETPKAGDRVFKKVTNVVVGNNRYSSLAACENLRSLGLNTLLLTATLEGEARQVGIVLASTVREVLASGNPVRRPAGIVVGGETTVIVTGKGKGGRNQEIPLAAVSRLKDMDGVAIASLSTDGIDGPTDAAGAIVDGKTFGRAMKIGMHPDSFLTGNDSYHFFSKLGDLIFTGPTGTNVNDISVIVVL